MVTWSSLISIVAGASTAIVAGPEMVSVLVSIAGFDSVFAFLLAGATGLVSSSLELSSLEDDEELGAAFRFKPP